MGAMTIPTVADVDRIAALPDPVVRNRQITHCYFELSTALTAKLGAVANWCTFATWASQQAGCTIRGEDLERTLEQRLRISRVVAEVARDRADHVRRLIKQQAPLKRASAAVARGNLKVFAEIGREFARFLSDMPFDTFVNTLRPGDPPNGQRLLRDAFTAYHEALQSQQPAERAQLIYYGNLLVGFHEQTRLQPEIRAALDVARHDLEHLRAPLLQLLLPSGWARSRHLVARALGRKLPLDIAIDRVIDEVSREIREITTAELMTLQVAKRVIRLGTRLNIAYPIALQQLEHPPLRALALDIERKYQTVAQRDHDWSSFDYRMFFIGDLFRGYHERAEILGAP